MAIQPSAVARPIAHTLSPRRRWTNSGALVVCVSALVVLIALFVWILAYIVVQGAPALSLDFFTSLPTPVGVPGGGIANALVGSAMTVGLALVIAAPVGILAGVYTASHAHSRASDVIRFATDTLAGVPSIVMGIVAYAVVVQPQGHFSALAGAVVLAFIMVPIIVRTTDEMLRLVPRSLREASLALGAPVWSTSYRVVVPAALNGILTGLLLAVARAAGEAAPMLFTAFGNPFMSTDFSEPVATLPHTVFIYAISPYEDWRQKAWATALVLITLVLVLNIAARAIVSLRSRHLGVSQ